jgi:hypothetical protein
MRRLLTIALLAFAAFALAPSFAQAQDVDPCDANPDAAECNVPALTVTDAGPACPNGGWILAFFGEPAPPLCWPAPAAPTATAPAPAVAPVTQVINQVIQQPVIQTIQSPGCSSRRAFTVRLPGRFHAHTDVVVRVGREYMHDPLGGGFHPGRPPTVTIQDDRRVPVVMAGQPCGLYSLIVTRKHKQPLIRFYIAGPNGSIAGVNLASELAARYRARAAARPVASAAVHATGMYFDDDGCHAPGEEGIPDNLPPKIHTFMVAGELRALMFLRDQIDHENATIYCAMQEAVSWDNLDMQDARHASVTWRVTAHYGDFLIGWRSECRLKRVVQPPGILNPRPVIATVMRCGGWWKEHWG